MDDCRVSRFWSGRVTVAFWVAVLMVLPVRAWAEVATPASVFLDSLGITAHVSLAQVPYKDVFALTGKLDYLGLKHVRDDVHETSSTIARYETLGADGIKLTLMLSPALVPDINGALSALAPSSAAIDTLEGTSDVAFTSPMYEGYSGVAAALAYQRALWSVAKANPQYAATAKVAQFTYGPVVANPGEPGLADVGNVHLYPPSRQPPFYTIAMAARTLGLPSQRPILPSSTIRPRWMARRASMRRHKPSTCWTVCLTRSSLVFSGPTLTKSWTRARSRPCLGRTSGFSIMTAPQSSPHGRCTT